MNARKKRLIKKLMGAGVGRNDAAAFVRVRSHLKSTGQLKKLLPEMEIPEPPIRAMMNLSTRELVPQVLRAEHSISRLEMALQPGEVLRQRVNRELARRLADGLMDSALIQYTEHQQTDSVRIRAEVRLLPTTSQEE